MSDLDSLLDTLADKIAAKLRGVQTVDAPATGKKLSTLETAARLGVHEHTVRRWCAQGCPVEVLPGGRRRFELAEVTAWLKARRAA